MSYDQHHGWASCRIHLPGLRPVPVCKVRDRTRLRRLRPRQRCTYPHGQTDSFDGYQPTSARLLNLLQGHPTGRDEAMHGSIEAQPIKGSQVNSQVGDSKLDR